MQPVTPAQAKSRLIEGNRRFVAGEPPQGDRSAARRAELEGGQHPFAAVVGCADSRVPPEIVFDQGLGDLIVVRTAANVLDGVGVGSIEYTVSHLSIPLVVVLGHEKCAGIAAAVASHERGGSASGDMASVFCRLDPAIAQAEQEACLPDGICEAVCCDNVQRVVEQLKASPVLAGLLHDGELDIVGAKYLLADGRVEWLT